jgi:DNA invertase Pin-like site-specific DNA recombinase
MPRPQASSSGRSGSRVLGYSRVSSREQALGTSLKDQQNRLEAFAKKRGLGKVQHFVEAESAVHEKFERREKMQQLMASLLRGDTVLCDKLDRWSRDPEFTYRSMREIREIGARVFFVDEGFDGLDPTTPEGDSMLNMRVLMAREEHKRIKLRMVGTRKLLRNQGFYVEGQTPEGYCRPYAHGSDRRKARHTLVIDEPRAEIVRELFRLSARDWSLSELLAHVQKRDKDRRWEKGGIHKMLRNRIYLGEVKDSNEKWIKGQHDALVSPELFARVQSGFANRRLGGAKAGADSRTKQWLLRGLASCGKCGARMGPGYGGGFGGAKNYVDYYRCNRKCGARYVPIDDVHILVEETILGRLVHLRGEISRASTKPTGERLTTDFARERLAVERKRELLVDLHLDGKITRDSFDTRMAKLDAERTRIDSAEAQERRRAPIQDVNVRRALLANVVKLEQAWKAMPVETRRRVIVLLTTSVRIERDQPPVIEWRSPEELAAEITPNSPLASVRITV